MEDAPFWPNIERFARFFISSVAGLILQLLSPFAMFSRSPALAAVGGTLFIGILAFIYITLTAMQAPLDVAHSKAQEPDRAVAESPSSSQTAPPDARYAL